MNEFKLTPADIAALRVLLARGEADGWNHSIYQVNNGLHEHVWRPGFDAHAAMVSLFKGTVTIEMRAGHVWQVPVESVAQVTTVLELAGALPAAPAAPGWESPAALQQAYDEMTAMYEAAEAELAAERRGWDQPRERFVHPGARGFDRSHYFGDACPGGHFNHDLATPAQQPCHFCTQCGKPMASEDTAAGRRVCGECSKPCPSCCTEIGERFGPVDCVTCDGTGAVPVNSTPIREMETGRIVGWYPTEPEAGETEGPDIVPAAGGEWL